MAYSSEEPTMATADSEVRAVLEEWAAATRLSRTDEILKHHSTLIHTAAVGRSGRQTQGEKLCSIMKICPSLPVTMSLSPIASYAAVARFRTGEPSGLAAGNILLEKGRQLMDG